MPRVRGRSFGVPARRSLPVVLERAVRARSSTRGLRCAALLLAAAACRDPAPPPSAAVDRYVVRGEIARLPARPGDELSVRHEAMPGFKDRTGRVVGMDAMVMGFGVGKELPLAGLAVGDKVQLTFAVDWSRPALTVERLERLPADTPLQFGAAGR